MSSLIKINLKKIASGKLLYRHRELNPVLCDNLEGWDKVGGGGGSRGRGHTHILTNSHCYMAETNTTLKSSYPPIKNKFKK